MLTTHTLREDDAEPKRMTKLVDRILLESTPLVAASAVVPPQDGEQTNAVLFTPAQWTAKGFETLILENEPQDGGSLNSRKSLGYWHSALNGYLHTRQALPSPFRDEMQRRRRGLRPWFAHAALLNGEMIPVSIDDLSSSRDAKVPPYLYSCFHCESEYKHHEKLARHLQTEHNVRGAISKAYIACLRKTAADLQIPERQVCPGWWAPDHSTGNEIFGSKLVTPDHECEQPNRTVGDTMLHLALKYNARVDQVLAILEGWSVEMNARTLHACPELAVRAHKKGGRGEGGRL